ncbi:MAG: hypothetical protein A3Q59_05210 [Methanomethylophilus alvi]|nr:MAG: hypothetical protein A3Q59_05210 [Methanomethylophilus alvi]
MFSKDCPYVRMDISTDRIAATASIVSSMVAAGLMFRLILYFFLARPAISFISIAHAEKYNIFIETLSDGI